MEEDDRDDLLASEEEESLSETEEHCLPFDKPENVPQTLHVYEEHSKLEFFTVKLTLIFSSLFLVVLLPLCMETINVASDAYTMILMTNVVTVVIAFTILLVLKNVCSHYKSLKMFKIPVNWLRILEIGVLYGFSGILVIYALDRKRVVCHIQDPVKGLVLIFSLLYYFFFCRKLMGLQRIFSTTTIIVGLFISVDYGLCDEFKCRGFEREHHADDAGEWSWQTHTIWTTVYIFGLALFAFCFTALDRCLLSTDSNTVESTADFGISSSLLSTVSRLVSSGNSIGTSNNPLLSRNSAVNTVQAHKAPFSLHVVFWLHLVGVIVAFGFFWTDLIPAIGKASTASEFLNFTTNGAFCVFIPPQFSATASKECGGIFLFFWLFLVTYLTFIVSSIRFLSLSQSAVHTIATMASSLPLVFIWWSLFHITTPAKGLIVWAPSLTGELICALLGLPVVILGLSLLCKSHFKDCLLYKMQASQMNAGPHYA